MTKADLIIRASRMKAASRIRDLELSLDEARYWADSLLRKIETLEALIEVKDVALTRIVNECSRFPIKDGLAFRVESIALNGLAAKLMARTAPARETE